MDYEKEYNEVLKRAKELHDSGNALTKRQMEVIFPQLAENEDERIRRRIRLCLDECVHSDIIRDYERDECLAYLEKQKEQQPRFYPGDVIKCTSTGSLWVRCKAGDNIRSDGHTACIGGGYELASEEEAVQFFQELNENGYQWDCIKGRPMKKEQKPNIELIQRSWYMEGYHDRKFGNEPKWVIKTGNGGPKYEENPKYGQMLDEEQKPAISREEILHQLFQNGSIKLSDYLYLTEEQKPAELETLGKPMTHEEWAEDYWEHHKFASPNGNDKCDVIQFEHKGFIDFCMAYCAPSFLETHRGTDVLSRYGCEWL